MLARPVNRALIDGESSIELSAKFAVRNLRIAEINILIELRGIKAEHEAR